MIQHDFYRSVGSKAVGSSEIRLQSVVETLHGAERDLTARLEPVEDEGLVRAQHAGDLPHRLDTRAQGLRAPLVHELRRPGRGDVLPEELELLLQKVGADGPQGAGEQLLELDGLIVGEVLRALQQAPTRVHQHDLLATCSASSADLAGLLRSHVIAERLRTTPTQRVAEYLRRTRVLSESEEEAAARALLVEVHGAVRDALKRIDASLAEVRERERAFEKGEFRAQVREETMARLRGHPEEAEAIAGLLTPQVPA